MIASSLPSRAPGSVGPSSLRLASGKSIGTAVPRTTIPPAIGISTVSLLGTPHRLPDAMEYAILEWVDWFNIRRSFEPIGNVPPAEFEKVYYTHQESLAVGTGLSAPRKPLISCRLESGAGKVEPTA